MSPTASGVIPYRPAQARGDDTAWLGMVIFLGSWAMMFAALFFAYGVLRLRQPSWPPPGTLALPVLLPALNTIVLALNAVALQGALLAARRGELPWMRLGLVLGLILGAVFVGGQLLLWTRLFREGLAFEDGSLAAVVYGLTGFHALHVVVGLVGLLTLLPPALAGTLNAARHNRLRLWVMYWHFVGVVWLAMFLLIFLL
ncbi:MAG TPA: cytochrome c oxidase subunit 3 [Myxococcaceae bacterium]|nr:cytochrome c oxidase subunit 3 [Myxococcaceae bacterium]